jgi:elongation factor G
MRSIPLDRYRNIGILASLDAGRTTTTERILAAARREAAAVAVGSPVQKPLPAWFEQDNQRDITLTSAATSCVWRDCRINIIELPTAPHQPEDSAIAALDAAVVLIDGAKGVCDDIGLALARLDALGIVRLVFVNKLDRSDAVLSGLASIGPAQPVLLQLPLQDGGAGLTGIVDLVTGATVSWDGSRHDAASVAGPVPGDLAEAVAAGRVRIRAALTAAGIPADGEDLPIPVRRAIRDNAIVPVLVGSAFRNRGIEILLDAIVDYFPAPSDMQLRAVAVDGRRVDRRPADDEPFAGLAFQTLEDPEAGKLTFVRIYSGVVATGNLMLNSVSTSPEQIGPMVRMHANHTESVHEAHAGDVVGLFGLEHTMTGDTLCDPAAPVILERIPASAGRTKH